MCSEGLKLAGCSPKICCCQASCIPRTSHYLDIITIPFWERERHRHITEKLLIFLYMLLSYRCISFTFGLKIWLGMLPDSWFIPKWLKNEAQKSCKAWMERLFKWGIISKYFIKKGNYKCWVLVKLSSPRLVPSDIGSDPESLLSAKSNQYKFERLPNVGGMLPVNLLEFKDLQKQYPRILVMLHQK